jgi:hypothetical protein
VASDKSYANETRIANLVNALGPVNPGAGGGGNGQRVTQVNAGQTINSTGMGHIFSGFAVTPGYYLVEAHLIVDANAGGSATFRFTGPAASGYLMTFRKLQMNTSDGTTDGETSGGSGYNTGSIGPTGTFAATFYSIHFTGCWWDFTASGSFGLECANTAGASDTFDIYTGSTMTVESVGQTS